MKAAAAASLLQFCAAACPAGNAPAPAGRYNVVVVLMETLRADHLGCYGYGRATSPNIDRLAAGSAVFENAFAQSSQSLISAASVFTGLYPPTHGVVTANRSLNRAVPTLAGELKKHGYSTAAFTAGFFLNRGFGLNSGFDAYDDSEDFGTLADVLPKAVKWLRGNSYKRFFLLVHGYDAHAPYRAPTEFLGKFRAGYSGQLSGVPLDYNLADRIWRDGLYTDFRLDKKVSVLDKSDTGYIISQYDGAVLYADSGVGELLKELDSLKLADRTVVLFMSSAGEALMDHGTIISSFHGGLYDEGIHVPLIIRTPGFKAERVKGTVQLVDVMPTVLSLLGFAAPPSLQGISLCAAMKGKELPPRTVYAQTLSLKTETPSVGIRRYPWKLFTEDGEYGLFDLAKDPGEQRNLASENPTELAAMKKELDRMLKNMPRRRPAMDSQPLPEVKERMKALGYWWLDRPRANYWLEQRKSGEQTK